MRVVVIGGGFSGMASAARLAKLGHQVTVVEASDRLGGALGAVHHTLNDTPDPRSDSASGEIVWDAGAHHTMLPAVIRDLFRKSGRPLERELDLEPMEFVREHRFADGSILRLPGGSRAAQVRAGNALGEGLGRAWVDHVGRYGRDWELLRRDFYERPWQSELASDELRSLIGSRDSLARRVKALPDARLRAAATFSCVLAGQDPDRVPAWLGLSTYLEQNFGTWRVPGGMHQLADAMAQRLRTRKVAVALSTRAIDLTLGQDGRPSGVRTAQGTLPADAVVVATDPHLLPTLAASMKRPRRLLRSTPVSSTTSPDLTHLALDASLLAQTGIDLGPEGHEIVFHADRPDRTASSTVVIRTGGTAPAGVRAWTLLVRHGAGADPVEVLARLGTDLRPALLAQVTPPAAASSGYGPRWEDPREPVGGFTVASPIDRVVLAGAWAATGPGLPFTGLSGSLVTQVLGKA